MSEKKISFGKIFWPSLVAVLIVSVLSLIVFFLVLGGIISGLSPETEYSVKDKTVLHMKLNGAIGENSETKLDKMSLSFDSKMGLSDLLYGFEKAKKDSKIKGIFVEIDNVSCGMATATELRNAIKDFQTAGKFVVAYNAGELISQKEYYISSAAKEVYGFPTSTMEFMGLGAELMFFKKTLDMLDVEMQVIRGKNNDFKSAVEPYFRTEMSDSSKLQNQRYMNSIWENMRKDIAKDRNVSVSELNTIAENLQIRHAKDAVSKKLLDGVKYRDEILEILAKKAGEKNVDKINLQGFEKYAKKKFYQEQAMRQSDANVAVILAEGDVSVDGDGLSSQNICKYIREARLDKKIKTIVLRINSPGGSALASDEIWREVKLANKSKKVIVSMGDVAASGGYYIAAPASKIFAESNTITGSIGVFGVIPYTGKMLENKLGLTFDRVQTNKHALMSTNKKLTEEEMLIVQEEVEFIYKEFLQRVAEGRGMTTEAVNVIARGRVWTGTDALRIGLVDEIGGIKDAVKYAAKQAGVKDVKIKYWPKKKADPFEDIIEQLGERNETSIKVSNESMPQELVYYYQQLKRIENMKGVQMRLPFDIRF
jgi:protease IV